jgi:hypothetical protein
MNSIRLGRFLAIVLLTAGFASAREWLVPEEREYIQWAINDANDGDVISVWVPEGTQPPHTYLENPDYHGKGVLIINRSFQPGRTGCDSSAGWVVIDGQHLDRTITIEDVHEGTTAGLHGFTVTKGAASNGGGIYCSISSPENAPTGIAIESNHITGNHATGLGGGMYYEGGAGYLNFAARGNVVDWDTAFGTSGGGIYIAARQFLTFVLDENQVLNNQAALKGGGAYLAFVGEPPTPAAQMTANVFSANFLTGADDKQGAGIYSMGWSFPSRHNVVAGNTPNGVYSTSPGSHFLDLGTTGNPGFNVLMGNGDCDLIVHNNTPDEITQNAVGNYWGSLDKNRVLSRVRLEYPTTIHFLFDPIAASGKWFDVTEPDARCQTDVLVTGDLQIDANAQLTIEQGKVFTFFPNPDKTIPGPGCDPARCDLIVAGPNGPIPGGVLCADGTVANPIHFRFAATTLPKWDGIRVLGGSATLIGCEIRDAYTAILAAPHSQVTVSACTIHDNEFCGISTEPFTQLTVTGSTITNNPFCGIQTVHAIPATITGNSIGNSLTNNGVFGICCNDLQPGTQIGGNNLANQSFGISCHEYHDATPINITGNTVCGGPMTHPGQFYGLDLHGLNESVNVADNHVTNYLQGGVWEENSSASLNHNSIIHNQYNGVFCTGPVCLTTTPRLRCNTIDQSFADVRAEQGSSPDLGTSPEDPGNNSILSDLIGTGYWIVNNNLQDTMLAEGNWWGTTTPDQFLWRFSGPVDYSNWLMQPPPDPGDGGQSASTSEIRGATSLECYPNLCAHGTEIRYGLARAGNVSLTLHDATGRLVRVITKGLSRSGPARSALDVSHLPRGVYMLRLKTEGLTATRKLIVE